jgi:hypothetical protein
MSKNTDKKADKKAVEITKATITENLDTVAVSVAEMDTKAVGAKKSALLGLVGGVETFEQETDTNKRKLLDQCIKAINVRISEVKTENKAVAKEERKPLKESPLYNGLRSLLGLASAMRSRLRTDSEKDAASQKAEKAKKEHEAKIVQNAIAAGKVISADDVQNVKTATSLEEGVIALIDMAYRCKVSLSSLQDMIARRF